MQTRRGREAENLVRWCYVGLVPNMPSILERRNRHTKRLPTRPIPFLRQCRLLLRASFRYRHHRLDSSEVSFQSFRARRRTPSTWDCWRTIGLEIRLYRRRVRIDNVLSTARQNFSKGAVGVDGKTDM